MSSSSRLLVRCHPTPARSQEVHRANGPEEEYVRSGEGVVDWLSQHCSQLLPAWQDRERIGLVNEIAKRIRDRRNEAGHSQDPPAVRTREEMYALINLFPDYCIKLYELKNWLEQNPGSMGSPGPESSTASAPTNQVT
jgi:hypothetical protein